MSLPRLSSQQQGTRTSGFPQMGIEFHQELYQKKGGTKFSRQAGRRTLLLYFLVVARRAVLWELAGGCRCQETAAVRGAVSSACPGVCLFSLRGVVPVSSGPHHHLPPTKL